MICKCFFKLVNIKSQRSKRFRFLWIIYYALLFNIYILKTHLYIKKCTSFYDLLIDVIQCKRLMDRVSDALSFQSDYIDISIIEQKGVVRINHNNTKAKFSISLKELGSRIIEVEIDDTIGDNNEVITYRMNCYDNLWSDISCVKVDIITRICLQGLIQVNFFSYFMNDLQ